MARWIPWTRIAAYGWAAIQIACAPTYQSLPNHLELPTTDIQAIKNDVTNDWLSQGYSLEREDNMSISFSKQMGEQAGILYRAAAGGGVNSSTPEWHIKLTFVVLSGGKTNVFYNAFLNASNGFGGVERTDVTYEKMGRDAHTYLEGLAKNYGFKKELDSRGKLGISIDNRVVQIVHEGSPADTGGVKVGDQIISVNDVPLTGDFQGDVLKLTGPPESTATLMITRGPEILTITLVRRLLNAK